MKAAAASGIAALALCDWLWDSHAGLTFSHWTQVVVLTGLLLAIGFFFSWLNGLGLLLLTLPAFAYFLSRQKRNLQSLLIVFLDELAKEWRLLKFRETTQEISRVETRPIKTRGVPDKA